MNHLEWHIAMTTKPFIKPRRTSFIQRTKNLVAEYRRLRGLRLSRRMALDLACFYTVFPVRSVVAFFVGMAVAIVMMLAAGSATAAEYRVSFSHPAIGQRVGVQQLRDWNTCVKAAYATRARLVWARNLKVSCDGRAI